MSTFVNTVEVVGDYNMTNKIIMKTVTKYKDNIATRVGKCAFRKCVLLTTVDMPNITLIDENAFNECSTLTVLILRRTDSIVTLMNANALANTPIAGGTGYIYVPSALVDAYKADTEWSVYASQIRAIEDYPYIHNPYTWERVLIAIEEKTYKEYYNIGDVIPLDLGSEGVVNMIIVAFDSDELADGSGTAPITWVSSEALANKYRMNPELVTNDDGTYQEGTGAIGGWGASELRAYLNDTVKLLIPEAIRSKIKEVNKYSVSFDTSGAKDRAACSIDSIWIPSLYEFDNSNNSGRETKGVCYKNNIGLTPNFSVFNVGHAPVIQTRTASSTTSFKAVGAASSSAYNAYMLRETCFGFCT